MINESDLVAFEYYEALEKPSKMKTNADRVMEFHEVFCPDQINAPWSESGMKLRLDLIQEEVRELFNAWDEDIYDGYEEAVVKELVDLLYVAYGTGIFLGVDVDEAFRRVHESNMSKLDEKGKPIRRADGKVLKGPNYKEPDLRDLV